MPYADRLRDVADWFRQLWAESLGKARDRAGETVFVGPTPVKSLGATDQHSQVQLYVEGPFDKTITFLAEAEPRGGRAASPSSTRDVAELGYLGGHTLGELLRVELGGHRGRAHPARPHEHDARPAARGRPHARRALHAPGDRHRLRRRLLRRRPLDQPGVELGKQFTYGIMGRAGYERFRDE